MADKIKVKSIEVAFPDGSSMTLSVEDAEELFSQLKKLFGDKTVYMPSAPIVIERDYWPRWDRPTYICETTPNTATPSPALPQVWCNS